MSVVARPAVDVFGVPPAFSGGLPFSGLVHVATFALVIAGRYGWWLQARTQRPLAVLEGAPA
jgi:nicotinamide mononucleotide transporter